VPMVHGHVWCMLCSVYNKKNYLRFNNFLSL
jgi:hypothetical protein